MDPMDLNEATDPALLGEEIEGEIEAVDAPAEDKADDKPADDKPKEEHVDQAIPRARFNEVNDKFKAEAARAAALEAELAAMRAESAAPAKKDEPAAEAVDVNDLEEKYGELMMEGNTADAAKLRRQINAELIKGAHEQAVTTVREEMTKRQQEEADRRANEAFEADKSAFTDAVQQTLKEYPFLDVKSAEANKEAIDDVISFRDYYHKKGDPLSTALIKAVNKVAPDYVKAPENVTKLVDKRKEDAVKRNIEDAKKQPVALVSGVGNRAAPSTAVPTKQEDYEKLPEAERERLLA